MLSRLKNLKTFDPVEARNSIILNTVSENIKVEDLK